MPHAPRSPRLEFRDLDDVAEALRREGGRFSASRRLVLETLFAAEGPISAERIAAESGGALDASSVYRALERLEELGAVRHLHVAHGPGLYALIVAGEREYLACERCDRVTAVDAARLDPVRRRILADFGYEARFSHFPIVGLCEDCRRLEEGASG